MTTYVHVPLLGLLSSCSVLILSLEPWVGAQGEELAGTCRLPFYLWLPVALT